MSMRRSGERSCEGRDGARRRGGQDAALKVAGDSVLFGASPPFLRAFCTYMDRGISVEEGGLRILWNKHGIRHRFGMSSPSGCSTCAPVAGACLAVPPYPHPLARQPWPLCRESKVSIRPQPVPLSHRTQHVQISDLNQGVGKGLTRRLRVRLGSAGAGRPRDLTAGKLTPKLSHKIAEIRGRQWAPLSRQPPPRFHCCRAAGRTTSRSRPRAVTADHEFVAAKLLFERVRSQGPVAAGVHRGPTQAPSASAPRLLARRHGQRLQELVACVAM